MKYLDLKYEPKDDIVCEFYAEPAGMGIRELASRIAAESSVGTWTQVQTSRPYMEDLAARVFSIKKNRIRIAYPLGLFEPGNAPQILSSIAGNIFGMKAVRNLRLEDVVFPPDILAGFEGPLLGTGGIRNLMKVRDRPFIGTIIKPKLGLNTEDHAAVAYESWLGGCDFVKDDENLTSQGFNPFEKRVLKTLEMRDRAQSETGEKKLYLANVTGEVNTMMGRIDFIKEHGGEYFMIDMLTCGFSALQTARERGSGLAIHAHRAMHAAITKNPRHGISMLVLARFARLIGADQLHIGTAVGKMEGNKEGVKRIADEMRNSRGWGKIKSVLPVCSGGLHAGHVPKLVNMLGNDIIIQMGGGIHWHPRGSRYGAMGARQAVEATARGVGLSEQAKTNKELREAIRYWKIK